MIKFETLGAYDVVKVNPVITSDNKVANYQFVTDDGDVYLIVNTLVGDDSYREDMTFKAGEYLNGYLVKSLEGLNIVIDEKHIAYKSGETYANDIAADVILTINAAGKLEIANAAPASGVYFKVKDKVMLTEKAVKAKVMVVDVDTDTVYNPEA